MHTIDQRIEALRNEMLKNKVDACIIPSNDPHMGEYIPEHWACRKWISGFTGSAGIAVITQETAGLWTDSRYFLQAEKEFEGTEMRLFKMTIPHFPHHVDWLVENLPEGSRINIYGEILSLADYDYLKSKLDTKNIQIETKTDLIHAIWKDRPALPKNKIFTHEIQYAGKSRIEKIQEIRTQMKEKGADYNLITTLDDIAWVFNLRGNDIEFNPVFVSYAVIGLNKTTLFINPEKLDKKTSETLNADGIELKDYQDIYQFIANLPGQSVLYLSKSKLSLKLFEQIPPDVKIMDGLNFSTLLKSKKNPTEVALMKEVMVKDGVALEKFLYWLEQHVGNTDIDEFSAAEKLTEFRASQDNFMGPSFWPISGYKGNGAIVHYHVSKESASPLKPEGIYLIDSGGQYLDGTTDTTRTISLGNPKDQEKIDFTLALKGTIDLAMAVFPLGTKGYQIEMLARQALWSHGKNYGHGTGHGVGFFLNVHEGPQTIGSGASGNQDVYLDEGMITSDEPAFYVEGEYGLRTENLILCTEKMETIYGKFMHFETITLCHIDQNLLKKDLLTSEEINWLNEYHQKVFDKLSPHLSMEEKKWLSVKTKRI